MAGSAQPKAIQAPVNVLARFDWTEKACVG